MRQRELDFANDPKGAIEQSSSKLAWVMVLTIGALMAAAIVWASFARVEQVTTGEGQVIPSSQVQVVESLDPGIVSQILVSEGDSVKKGQVLLRIDATGASARLGELSQQLVSLRAELARLNAEAKGAKTFSLPTEMSQEQSASYQDQLAIFEVNKRRLDEQRAIRQQQYQQKQQSMAEIEANAQKQNVSFDLLQRELEITQKLFKRKAVPEIEFLRLKRAVGELEADIGISMAIKARIEAELEELKTLLTSEETEFLTQVQSRISNVNTEISVVEESIRGAKERVDRAVLRAPIDGVVNQFNVVGIGEVVKAGVTIAEIVPVDDNLLVEARIRPQDIGFISPGLDAVIRLSAYDFTKYGVLTGRVERIGVDTITDENKETFYRVIVSTTQDKSSAYGSSLKVIPGMIASIDISIGERSIMDYLLKPVLRVTDRALRDPS